MQRILVSWFHHGFKPAPHFSRSMGAEDPDAAPQETPEGEEGGAGEAEGEEGAWRGT